MREFVELAFSHVGRSVEWTGSGIDEKGLDASSGEVLVAIDPSYMRPTDPRLLLGDASKARDELGWAPRTTFTQLVKIMVDAETAKGVSAR